jgi:hypothetical protein
MEQLSTYIKKYRSLLYATMGGSDIDKRIPCIYFAGNDECKKPNGCYCKKLAEIKGNIDYHIPPEYRDLTINNASGFITTRDGARKQVWTNKNKLQIQTLLRDYLFGCEELINLCDREGCNKASKLDIRYQNCENLVIHGAVHREKNRGIPTQPLPTGKTLIACLVIKEAIWRRLYSTNKADTYHIVSYQTLRHDLKNKNENAYTYKETDWLVIDDISLPVNENNFDHQMIVGLLDDFLMTRMENRLPTILVCEFDALALDYSSQLGYSFQKLITLKNTWHIRVGENTSHE